MSLALGLGLGVPYGGAVIAFPLSLFAAGEQGAWYDPSDFSTMFQDDAGTTPVTAVDQSVGLIRDKSGRGNHASQSNASFKPLLKQDGSGLYHLLFDGTDDFLLTSSIDFTGTNKVTAHAGARKLNDAALNVLFEFSTSTSNAGMFRIAAPAGAGAATYDFVSRGSATSQVVSTTAFAAPVTNVITGLGDIANDGAIIRINGVQNNTSATDQGTGNYGNYALYVGRRGGSTLPFNGRLYSLIIRGVQSSAAEIASAETWVNGKTGAY